jgi:DNA-binding HxlR family transcriptional regulator
MAHPPLDPFDPDCPTRQVLDRIAAKWTVLIVVALEPRAKRFGELRREVGGISQKMLTQRVAASSATGWCCGT